MVFLEFLCCEFARLLMSYVWKIIIKNMSLNNAVVQPQ